MSNSASLFSWPGYRMLNEIDGSAGGVAIGHGLVESPKTNGVEAVLPADIVLLCAHVGGSIWMRNRSNFTNFAREGCVGSANLGIGGCSYDIEYRADRCEFVAFMIARSWFDLVIDDNAKSTRLEFVDPQNRQADQLAVLGRMALLCGGKGPVDRLLADSIGYAVAAGILRSWSNFAVSDAPEASATLAPGDRRMLHVRDYVEANIAAPITLHDLATVSGLSIPQFMRHFKAAFGMPPYRWIQHRKAVAAAQGA